MAPRAGCADGGRRSAATGGGPRRRRAAAAALGGASAAAAALAAVLALLLAGAVPGARAVGIETQTIRIGGGRARQAKEFKENQGTPLSRATVERVEALERSLESDLGAESTRMGLQGFVSEHQLAFEEATAAVDDAPAGKARAVALVRAVEVAELLDRVAVMELRMCEHDAEGVPESVVNSADFDEENPAHTARARIGELVTLRQSAALGAVTLARTSAAERNVVADGVSPLDERVLTLARSLKSFVSMAGDDKDPRVVADVLKARSEAYGLLKGLVDGDSAVAGEAEELLIDVGRELAEALIRAAEASGAADVGGSEVTAAQAARSAVDSAVAVHGRKHGRTLDAQLTLARALHAAGDSDGARAAARAAANGAGSDSGDRRRAQAEQLLGALAQEAECASDED